MSESAAFFVPASASGCRHTCTPAIPPSKKPVSFGGTYFHPPKISVLAILLDIARDSFKSQYVVTSNSCPEKIFSLPAMVCTCASENLLSASLSSILTRASRSSSATLFNRAASFALTAARSIAFPACFSAVSARSSALVALSNAVSARPLDSVAMFPASVARLLASRASTVRDATVSVNNRFVRTSAIRPNARPIIRTKNACFSTLFRRPSFTLPLSMCSKSARPSKSAPIMTISSATYSTPSQKEEETQSEAIQAILRRAHRYRLERDVVVGNALVHRRGGLRSCRWTRPRGAAHSGLRGFLGEAFVHAGAGGASATLAAAA